MIFYVKNSKEEKKARVFHRNSWGNANTETRHAINMVKSGGNMSKFVMSKILNAI